MFKIPNNDILIKNISWLTKFKKLKRAIASKIKFFEENPQTKIINFYREKGLLTFWSKFNFVKLL